ncbi:MAG: flagellar hook-associated protein FlgK [Alphaproteobacteria bacterium]
MSLTISLQSALSAMQAAQAAFQIASNNVANVNTEGYSRKQATQESVVVDGLGSGVTLSEIERIVDKNLLRQVREQASLVSDLRVRDTYLSRMQELFGTLDSNGGLSHLMTELGGAYEALATTPESPAARAELINLAVRTADRLRVFADAAQDMRLEADQQIGDAVTEINNKLDLINTLNGQITSARALDQPSGELEDSRDVALNELSGLIGIRYFERADGQVVVLTESGRPLVDSLVVPLSHVPAAQLTADIFYPGGGIQGIAFGTGGPDLTTEIQSGKLAGLIELRDRSLTDFQAQIDRLAEALRDGINAQHNNGTAYPPPQMLTGTKTVNAGDQPPMSGSFRVAVVDASGVVVESQDINLGGLAPPSIGQLVTAIDGMTNASASINAQGQVVVTASGGNRIAVNELDSAVTVGPATRGMAEFLGLNDFFTSGETYTRFLSDRRASSTASLGLPAGGTLTVSYPGGATAIAYNATDSLSDIATAINAALGAQNITATVVPDGAGYRLDIVDGDGDNLFLSDTSTLVTALNLRAGRTGTSSRLDVRADIENDHNLLALGRLSGASPLNAGTIALSLGDNSTVQAIAAMLSGPVSLGPAGGLPAMNALLADYAGSIMSTNASQAQTTSKQLAAEESYEVALESRAKSVSQVNIDEEMANIMILQNAYTASARLTTTVGEMMDVLLEVAQ